MRSGFVIIYLLFEIFHTSGVFAFNEKNLKQIESLQKQGKYCEASKITSECLISKNWSDLLEKCLVIGEDVTEICVRTYFDHVYTLDGINKDQEYLKNKFYELKLNSSSKVLIGEKLSIAYDFDYARKLMRDYKESKSREDTMLLLIETLSWRDPLWKEYIKDFPKKYPDSKSLNLIKCLTGQILYNKWAFLDPDKGEWAVRNDFNNPKVQKLRQEALALFKDILDDHHGKRPLDYPCQDQLLERALKDLTAGSTKDPIQYFSSD